jgi:hypothetical protein
VRTNATGNYSYSYIDPSDTRGPKLPQPGVFAMHVGPCTSCTGTTIESKVTLGETTQGVTISCTGTSPTVYPASAKANTIIFGFEGVLPPQGSGTPVFAITFGPGVCSNYPAGATLHSSGDYCTVEKSFTYTVTQVYGCAEGSANGTASPQ